MRSQPDEAEFRLTQAELIEMRTADMTGISEYELWYMDETGFTLAPCLP